MWLGFFSYLILSITSVIPSTVFFNFGLLRELPRPKGLWLSFRHFVRYTVTPPDINDSTHNTNVTIIRLLTSNFTRQMC